MGEPTPDTLEAFAAMDRFTEELVKAGVFVAAAGLKNGRRPSASCAKVLAVPSSMGRSPRRASWSSGSRFGRSRTWTRRWPGRSVLPRHAGQSEMEIRPFYEAADLAEFVTPEELSAPREGESGKLGVA